MKKFIIIVVAVFITKISSAQSNSTDYFGQTPPGSTPTLFAQGIISLPNFSEIRVVFSPDGKECFFSKSSPGNAYPWHLYYTKCVSNIWTAPAVAPFPQQGDFTAQPFFSADGNSLYFTSKKNGSNDIWVSHRTTEGWGTPEVLPAPINTSDNDVYYSETLDGTAYFASNRSGGIGELDIWRACRMADQSLKVENLGAVINTSGYDYDPCVSPEEEYILFASLRDGFAMVYICYNDGNGGWTKPINMNEVIPGFNTGGADGPSLSPDGKYLFWRRYYEGQPDIYWVSTEKIDSLKRILVGIGHKNQVTPKLLYLFHNYPNPFNTSTIIRYSLAQPSQIRLSVFDLQGRAVKTPVDSYQSAGEYLSVWNGIDDSENQVSSGVYCYSLAADKMKLQRK